MKLIAPVNSFESCKMQIQAGAEEIYLGYKVDIYKRFHFSARNQMSKDGRYMVPDKNEFAEIVKYAHERNVSVSLTANHGVYSDYQEGDIDIEKSFMDYIMFAVDCKVDNIIFADIGLLSKINKMNLPINIHASASLDISNISQLLFLKDLGVVRVVLSYQTDIEEINELCQMGIMEIEVFGTGGCSFSAYCMLGHGMKYGVPCRCKYYVDDKSQSVPFIDSYQSCSICSIHNITQTGVTGIKIVGREVDHKLIVPTTKLFRKAIDLAKETTLEEYKIKVNNIIPSWWKRTICAKKQCKYEQNVTQKFNLY